MERVPSSSFYKRSTTQILILYRKTSEKENNRSITLINIDAKLLNKILTNLSQQHIEVSTV